MAAMNNPLPANLEAESAVLGAIFLNNDALVEAKEYIDVTDFSTEQNRLIFAAMESLFDQNQSIDLVTITDYLETHQQLNLVNGVTYLTELAIDTPTAENVVYYAQIVKAKSNLRKIIQLSQTMANDSYQQQKDVDAIIEEAEKTLMDISENQRKQDIKKIDNVIYQVLEDIQHRFENDEEITGLSTGYPLLDKMTTGLHPDELIIIAARPAVGKTAFALNIAQNVAVKSQKAVAIFSLEMGAESLVSRMLCAEGTIESYHMRTGEFTTDEWEDKLPLAAANLATAPIYIDDTPGIKVAEIRAKCRKIAQETKNLGLVVIDYLQLIEAGGSRRESRQQEVSEISRQLKKLAKELKVPIIALSQLSRSVEQRQDKRPVLSDIRESGSIEQDADIVAFLYREEYYDREDGTEDNDKHNDNFNEIQADVTEVIIEKNRSGARGTVPLIFMKNYNKFASQSFEDVPLDR